MSPTQALTEPLAELIAIPSISADPTHGDDVLAAGEWVRDRIRAGGGEDVRTLDGTDTTVREGDTIILLPAMAGGC